MIVVLKFSWNEAQIILGEILSILLSVSKARRLRNIPALHMVALKEFFRVDAEINVLSLPVSWYYFLFTMIVRGAYDKFTEFFRMGIWNCRRLLKIQYVIAIHLMRWLINFYDFRFKWTATAATEIHPTKAWLSQLVNFKNAIWT